MIRLSRMPAKTLAAPMRERGRRSGGRGGSWGAIWPAGSMLSAGSLTARSLRKIVPIQDRIVKEPEIRQVEEPVQRIEGVQDHPPLARREVEDRRLAVHHVLPPDEAGEHQPVVLFLFQLRLGRRGRGSLPINVLHHNPGGILLLRRRLLLISLRLLGAE